MKRPNVFSIPTGVPFLPTLADAALSGRLCGPAGPDDPLSPADMTVLLPTRRAARALRQILVERTAGRAAILPRIRTLGDIDEEEHLLHDAREDGAEALTLPPAVSRLERSLTLTRLVLAWGRAVRRAGLEAGLDQPILIPASAADAARLADDLGRMIDEMATAGVGWQAIDGLAPDDYPRYWQMTLGFLKIAGERWPEVLAERGLVDPAARRDRLIRATAERWRTAPPPGPIIAAGSTGSIPASAVLLATIAELSNGAVVLPGLDRSLDDEGWAAIGGAAKADEGAPSHPQFGMKALLSAIGIDRRDVEVLAVPPPRLAARAALIAEAMRPADTTDSWAAVALGDADEALAGVDLLVAKNEQEEALAIAVALREAMATPGLIAALATPDRNLARRVAVELRRWAIRVDDSAGRPLDTTLPGGFAILLAEVAASADPVRLLALAKHPLAGFGMAPSQCRRAARVLEIALLRGPGENGAIVDLPRHLVDARLQIDMRAQRFTPRVRRWLGKQDWTLAEALAIALARALGPLEALRQLPEVRANEAAALLAAALGAVAATGQRRATDLWQGPSGTALAELLDGLVASDGPAIAAAEFPGFLRALMAGIVVTPPAGADPRIHIWGALEARLQSVDLLILGGLDEGVWPGEIRSGAWLSRRMRSALGLPAPERRIGLAAHDITEALGTERVILTRAEKRSGTPTVASRWLQRIGALVGEERFGAMLARGARRVDLARRLDQAGPGGARPAARPEPKPPVSARPREISITSVETLIRDPYAIYARRILGLEALEPIGQRADPRIRGNLIHEALAEFTKASVGRPFDGAAADELLAIWRRHFAAIAAYPEVHAVWSLLAPRIVDWVIGWERERDPGVAERHAEIKGEIVFAAPGGPFKLTGRADRIDLFGDGRVGIYDYKTGAPPTAKQVLAFQPQLALEAAMVQAGAFGPAFAARSVAEMAWIGLGLVGKSEPLRSAVDDGLTADGVAAAAMVRLHALIAAYDDPAKGYLSQARPMFERRFPGDYDHLARVAEWRFAAGAAE